MAGAQLRIHLLGGFAVEVEGQLLPAAAWHRRRPADLLALLALAPGHSMPREQLVEVLWPDLGPTAGAANARKAAFHLRGALGLPEACVLADNQVQLMPAGTVWVDVDEFIARARRALATGDPAGCREASQHYPGPLLPNELYAPWAEEPRARLRELHLDLLQTGQLWGQLVAEDPTRELAHQELIRQHLARGDRAAAIRQFERAQDVLREELGVCPGAELTALYEEALAAQGRAAATPAMRARALLVWGGIHYERAELAEAEQAAREAKALAVDAGLTRELTEASELLGLSAYARGAWQDVFAAEFLTTLVATPELVPFLYDANMCMVEFALGEADGLRLVSQYGARLLIEGEQRDATAARALGRLLRGEAGVLAGGPTEDAREDLEAALDLHGDLGARTGHTVATERLAQLAALDGNPTVAGCGHTEALASAQRSAVPQHLVPWILGGMVEYAPDPDRAMAVLDEAETRCASLQVCGPCAMGLRVAGARVSADQGELDRAAALIALAGPVGQMWAGGPWQAALLEARAHVLAGSGGAPDDVAAQLAAAAEQFEAAQRPREAARCRTGAAV